MVICEFCGNAVESTIDKRDSDSGNIITGCYDCWAFIEDFHLYAGSFKFPPYKGIKVGDKAYCKIEENGAWYKGIVDSIKIVKIGKFYLYYYVCFIDYSNNTTISEVVYEEYIWPRSNNDDDTLIIDENELTKIIGTVVIDEDLAMGTYKEMDD